MLPDSTMKRIAEALAMAHVLDNMEYTGVYLPTWEITQEDTRYLRALESVIRKLAENQPIVIRGRGSQFILRDFPHAFHVLVVAPLEMRVKRVIKNMKVDEETAKKEIEHFDSINREFIKRYFHSELEDPINYDLVINTKHISLEAAATIIVDTLPLKG